MFNELLSDLPNTTADVLNSSNNGSQTVIGNISGHLQGGGGRLEEMISLGVTHFFYCDIQKAHDIDFSVGSGNDTLQIDGETYRIIQPDKMDYLDEETQHYKFLLRKNVG